MSQRPPKTYDSFVDRFPELGKAWDVLHRGARKAGPLGKRELALIKLGIAIGAQREGAVHSATRKALEAGCPARAIEQVAALAASTVGLPGAVAAWTWTLDELPKKGGQRGKAKKGRAARGRGRAGS